MSKEKLMYFGEDNSLQFRCIDNIDEFSEVIPIINRTLRAIDYNADDRGDGLLLGGDFFSRSIFEYFPDFKELEDSSNLSMYSGLNLMYGNVHLLLQNKDDSHFNLLGVCIVEYGENRGNNAITFRRDGTVSYKTSTSIPHQSYIFYGNFNTKDYSMYRYVKDFTRLPGGGYSCNGRTGEAKYTPGSMPEDYWSEEYMRTPFDPTEEVVGVIDSTPVLLFPPLNMIELMALFGSEIPLTFAHFDKFVSVDELNKMFSSKAVERDRNKGITKKIGKLEDNS